MGLPLVLQMVGSLRLLVMVLWPLRGFLQGRRC